jgi:predicted amidohydrolase YtcJ
MGSVDPKTRRHRIEHASQMTSEALEKMAKLRIPVCIQPQFVTSDFWTIDRVGSGRMRWSYPFRTMLDAGIPLSMGSDCPVERIDPMQLIKSAVTRDDYTERERLTVDQALRAYCLGGAYAAFEEQDKGSLEPGKLADFAVLSDDIYEASHADLKDIRVEMTVVGGHVAHDASARRG